jgi:hypothetical protein
MLLAVGHRSQLCCRGSVTPGQQFINVVDLVVGNSGEDNVEPSLGVDAIELGGLNQGEGNGHGFATTL